MYFWENEHNPPHIHAVYADKTMEFNIKKSKPLDGRIPIRIRRLVQLWINEHREELLEIWETQEFKRIKPLS